MNTKQIATFTRRTQEMYRRLMQGTLPVEATLVGLQKLIEEGFDSIIDLDADPFIPNEYTLETHTKGGTFDFYPTKIGLYLSAEQKNGEHVEGHKLLKKLKAQPIFNANLLDWLLRKENQRFIPKEWGDTSVFFWGTIYRDLSGDLCVRHLCRRGNGWTSMGYSLDYRYGNNSPAIIAVP